MSATASLRYSAEETSGAVKRKAQAESHSEQAELTIRQMARRFGVSLRTLRFYEDRGLITPRRDGTARFYRPADQVRMSMILRAKKLRFTLAEINGLIGRKDVDA
jgi:transposase-like protein